MFEFSCFGDTSRQSRDKYEAAATTLVQANYTMEIEVVWPRGSKGLD